VDSTILKGLAYLLGGTIVAVAGTVAAHAAYEYFVKKIRRSNKLGTAFLMLVLAVNAATLAILVNKVDDLSKTQQIQSRFYPAKDAWVEMRRVIGFAKEGGSIYVLNSFDLPFKGLAYGQNSNSVAESERKSYYELLEEKMKIVSYSRIVQVQDNMSLNLASLTDTTYLNHFKNMVALQEQADRPIFTKLILARSQYAMSFVIVENPGGNCLMTWQVDNRSPTGEYRAAGYMIVVDPEEVIIDHFKTLFNQVAQGKGSRLIRKEELEVTSPPARIEE
jgi:hypothetical protein